MRKVLLTLLAITGVVISLAVGASVQTKLTHSSIPTTQAPTLIDTLQLLAIKQSKSKLIITNNQLAAIENMLSQQRAALTPRVIESTMKILRCYRKQNILYNKILTIIDYSLPSNKKRLWIFDLSTNQLLFHTHVSHGIKSGALLSQYFSNRVNSKSSSIGVYETKKSYYGRHGLSLKLRGLDKGFNSNAYGRFIVMHGSWYVSKKFIKKYGRAGRSWGCPSVAPKYTKGIINTIKNDSLLIVYYPNYNWLVKSKFLNCDGLIKKLPFDLLATITKLEKQERPNIVFVDKNKNNKKDVNEPVVVISAERYQTIFNRKPPLVRMLRRQINKSEYIALNIDELYQLSDGAQNHNTSITNIIYFVVPEVKLKRGFYATEMKIISSGKIKNITPKPDALKEPKVHTIFFEKKSSVKLKSTNQFIRWLGL